MSRRWILVAALCIGAVFCTGAAWAQDAEAPAQEQGPSVQAFAGEFAYAGGSKQIEKMKAAVEAVVAEANFVIRGFARDKLLELCAPYKKISVTAQGESLTMQTERYGPWTSKVDGSTFSAKNSQGEPVKVKRSWRKGNIVEVVRSDGGSSTRVFQLSKDGKTLTMHVTIKSDKLDDPVKYAMSYRRQ